MKYTNKEYNLKRTVCKIFFGLLLIVLSNTVFSMIVAEIIFCLPVITVLLFSFLIALNLVFPWIIGKLRGDEFFYSNFVYDGDTVQEIVKTPSYFKRRMKICYIESVIFILLGIRYILAIIFGNYIYILFLILAIIAVVVNIIFGLSAYEQSGMKEEKANRILKEANKSDDEGKIFSFNFSLFPNLESLYNNFKYWNTMKARASNENDKVEAMIHTNKSMDELAKEVYLVFDEIKPTLIDKKTGNNIDWDIVINKPFDKLDHKQRLILARFLEGSFLYRLPDKYYSISTDID